MVAQRLRIRLQVRSHRRHWFDPWVRKILEEYMATYSSILAWRIPWTEEPGGLQSIESYRVELNLSNLAGTHESAKKCASKTNCKKYYRKRQQVT